MDYHYYLLLHSSEFNGFTEFSSKELTRMSHVKIFSSDKKNVCIMLFKQSYLTSITKGHISLYKPRLLIIWIIRYILPEENVKIVVSLSFYDSNHSSSYVGVKLQAVVG